MKKRLLVVVALTLLAVLVLTLVACGGSTEQAPDDSTSTPPSGQTPDSGDGDNEGEITPPENPGGEIAPPENPGGEIGEPEDPDDGGEVTDPDDGNEGEDPETPEQPAFVVDTVEKLLEYRSATLYDYLMENYASTAMTKLAGRDATVENADQIVWTATADDNSENITEIHIRCVYHDPNGTYMFYVATFVLENPIMLEDIINGNAPATVKFTRLDRTYFCNAIEADMEQNRPLAEAIITALGETFSPEDTILMGMDTASTDPQYSWVRNCYVKQITGTGVNEYTITINARNASGENLINQLILNVQAGEYKNNKVEKNVVMFETGVTADSVDKALPDSAA